MILKSLKQQEEQLAEMDRHIDRYAQEMHSSPGPEYEFYEQKCEDLIKQRRWVKFKLLTELRREIGQMKRRMNHGEKGLKPKREQLKRMYFRVRDGI
jgi:hypothetical protein